MSNTVRFVVKNLFNPLKRDILKLSPQFPLQTRTLYAKSTMGIDAFAEQRKNTKNQMANIEAKFRERMNTYATEDSTNMIFTEDLKNMIHLAESQDDLDLVVRMAKKFNGQNKQLRFGNFVFGPVLMRMFYVHNKADQALECFKSPELDGLFDQLISYQILLDLLYESGKYNEMLEVFELITSKQIQGAKYPRNAVVLVMAACYKLNSVESITYALKLWNDLAKAGHYPMRRATTFCAGLALNQNKPEVALEVMSAVKKPNYMTIRNIKVRALSEIGRFEEALILLKSIVTDDNPGEVVQTFNRDVLDYVKEAVSKTDNPELTLEFNRLVKLFEKEGHISETTLDSQLCSEIQQPPIMNNRQLNKFSRYDPEPSRRNSTLRPLRRPGLNEMV